MHHSDNAPCRAGETKSNANKVQHEQECFCRLRVLDLAIDIPVEVEWEPCEQEAPKEVGVDVDCVVESQHSVRKVGT